MSTKVLLFVISKRCKTAACVFSSKRCEITHLQRGYLNGGAACFSGDTSHSKLSDDMYERS